VLEDVLLFVVNKAGEEYGGKAGRPSLPGQS
jgi:hypothetical protein